MLCLSDDVVEVRRAALLALGNLGKDKPQAEEAVRKFSDDSDSATKLNALVALGLMGKVDETRIPALLTALGSHNEDTAKAASKALRNVAKESPQQVMPGLIDLLRKKEAASVGNALEVLRSMRSQAAEALPVVTALYPDLSSRDRIELVRAVPGIDTDGGVRHSSACASTQCAGTQGEARSPLGTPPFSPEGGPVHRRSYRSSPG